MDNKEKTIDEKALRNDYGNFIVEIIQDLNTGHLGWIYKPKNLYFYGSWRNPIDEEPSSLYSVDAELLKQFLAVNWKVLFNGGKVKISEKGWGTTLFAIINWQDLLYTNIAEKFI